MPSEFFTFGRSGSARFLLVALAVTGCGGAAPEAVLETGTRSLRCSRGELETTLHRETPLVREYLVGCNFMYARVHCRGDRCYPAQTRPPCIQGAPCFEEDPLTLEWKLEDEKLSLASPVSERSSTRSRAR